ncbi:hypothetical protein EDD76_10545 [Kineothrix alysoides]|uniref:Uncharacterized protein n=1 Tax=Kineothrix alysoides TaxID=1469948 RepID=A0A4R1R0P9_9FIRM|nr:hypothetical protein EDD76_10545 [Kineothrix alysoides]
MWYKIRTLIEIIVTLGTIILAIEKFIRLIKFNFKIRSL